MLSSYKVRFSLFQIGISWDLHFKTNLKLEPAFIRFFLSQKDKWILPLYNDQIQSILKFKFFSDLMYGLYA